MQTQEAAPVRRRPDGSIDVDFYASHADDLHRAAMAEALTTGGRALLGVFAMLARALSMRPAPGCPRPGHR